MCQEWARSMRPRLMHLGGFLPWMRTPLLDQFGTRAGVEGSRLFRLVRVSWQTARSTVRRIAIPFSCLMRYGPRIHDFLFRSWQGELEYSAARLIHACPQPAPMGIDDRPADR